MPKQEQRDFLSTLLDRGEHLYEVQMSRDEEEVLTQWIRRDFEDAFPQMEEFRQNMIDMARNWRGSTDESKDFPFEDCANIRVPLTSTFVEQLKARLIAALFSGQYIAKFSSLERMFKAEEIRDFNEWFDWELRNIVKLKPAMRDILHGALIYGNAFPEAYYDHKEGDLRSFRRFPLVQGQDPQGQVEQALQAILQEVSGSSVEDAPDYGVYNTIDAEGRKGRVVFYARLMDGVPELIAEITRNEVLFDGVKIWVPNIEDYVVIPTGGTVEEVPFWGNRLWLSIEDFRKGIADGYYRDLGEEENLRICACAQNKTPEFVQREETRLQDSERGTDQTDFSGYNPERKWIEVYKWEGAWRLNTKAYNDPDRYLEDKNQYAVWVAVRSWRVIRICRLEDLNKDAKRSPVHFGYIHEPNRLLDIGLAEWIRHVQVELDGIHNQRLDSGLVVNMPWGFYKPMAGFNREVLRFKPGEFKPVGDPSSVVMPQPNWQPTWSFAEEQLVRKYGGEQAGLSETAMGQYTSKRQSASEFVGTSSAIDLRTGAIVDYLLESFHELVYRILGLYQQFAPRRRLYQVAGENGEMINKTFEVDRLQGRIALQLSASLEASNKELQQKIALDMLQILMSQIFIQMGVVRADTIYAALKKITHEYGYSDVPFYKPDMPPQSDSPDIENRQMSMGIAPTGPTLSENFNEHLQVHSRLAASPDLNDKMPLASQQLLAEHIQATMQMQQIAQVMRMMQAQQAAAAQQMMIGKGINPGQVGDTGPGAGAGPGTAEEGAGAPDVSTPEAA